MKKLIIAFFLIISLFAFSQDKNNKLVFSNLGFSIKAFDLDKNISDYVVFTMYLPESDNFTPNINLIIQEYSDGLDNYKILSENQFLSNKMTIIKSEIKNSAYLMEYSGNIEGNDLHFYAKAVKKNNQIFLTTATCTANQLQKYSKQLFEVVESFKLEQ
jgi:hypothetical protein